jgi:hypothetical protein
MTNRSQSYTLVVILSVLSYGIFSNNLGHYWDDWPILWAESAFDFEKIREWAFYDRPIMVYVQYLHLQIFGNTPTVWHIYIAVLQCASALVLLKMGHLLWPNRYCETLAITVLFLIYPGFKAQPISITYAPYLLQQLLVLISLTLMICSIQVEHLRKWSITGAVTTLVAHLSISEYFLGFELIRPLLIWLVVSKSFTDRNESVSRIIKIWLPYLIVLIVYIVIYAMFSTTNREEVKFSFFASSLFSDPLAFITKRTDFILPDIIEVSLLAWAQPFQAAYTNHPAVGSAWAIGVLASFVCYFSLKATSRRRSKSPAIELLDWPRNMFWGGILVISLGMAPLWFSGVDVDLAERYGGYTLPSILGSSLLLGSFIHVIGKSQNERNILISLLVSIGVTVHVLSQDNFRRAWDHSANFLWQVSWRAPNLDKQTLVIIDHNIEHWRDNASYEFGIPLNFLYSQHEKSENLRYWALPLFAGSINNTSIKNITSQLGVKYNWSGRSLSFEGLIGDHIFTSYRPPRCVEFLTDPAEHIPGLIEMRRELAANSNINLVFTDGTGSATPLSSIYGSEPKKNWCYYFQKAKLAEQYQDWAEIIRLGIEATSLGLKPADDSEWKPFRHGYRKLHGNQEAAPFIPSSANL